MKALHIYRSASKGRTFTREEKIRIINHKKGISQKNNLISEMVMEEKRKIAKEAEAREMASKIRTFALNNPDMKIKGVKQKKTGEIWFQPREKGKIGKAIVIG